MDLILTIQQAYCCVGVEFNNNVSLFFLGSLPIMFHNSSQKKFWQFDGEAALEKQRYEANQKFRSKIMASGKVR